MLAGQTVSARAQSGGSVRLPEIVNVATPTPAAPAAREAEPEPAAAASERQVSGERLNAVPATRPGEVLEEAPGLIVTQHSGEGKANQYFLRGFNLDHGTDLAITVDGMPANMRTHGHGQGYADVNFLIPELIAAMRVRKGPYFADEGDFASAGALRIDYLDRLPKNIVQGTVGSFGYWRGLAAGSAPAGAGTVLSALEVNAYNGPWEVPDGLRKLNGVLRYSQGTLADGFAITAMAYANRWTSTDQIPERAVTAGLIDRFGSLDPTDGGQSSRFSLSGRWSRTGDANASKVEAYAIKSSLDLFNNFTYFLADPVNGDQFKQLDDRTLYGVNASHTIKGAVSGVESETTFGSQTRYDDIHVGLFKTLQRMTLSTVRDDRVQEASTGLYVSNTTRWSDWIRTVTGVRGDWFTGRVASDTPANSGDTSAAIASPKAGLVLGPFHKTELFLNGGFGFHSNDLRGATITVDPADQTTPLARVPLLVRSKGAEVGLRSKFIEGLDSAVSVFVLDFDSELLFVGDAGTTEPSRPSRRLGIEWTNRYKMAPWLALDFDLAVTRARFTDVDPTGNFIPGAPNLVASAGIILGRETGWFGAAKLRVFGPRPLIEDASVLSRTTTLLNGRIGYRFDNGVRVQLDGYNLTNAKSNQIDYFYVSRLPGEPLDGAADRHFHPVEPLAVRLTVAANW
jgi:outer membrane receptor protein involved in Fe transport